MKNRIVQFYNNHEVGIAIVTCVAGVTTAAIGIILLNKSNAPIKAVSRAIHDDGSMDVRVTLKNDNEKFYHWNPELAA